ncbi:MAG: DUF4157 domain-containing protein, partial [Chitinophagaceae bacterium]|nr:DUF4157 domain-containing protein [Chitinophagaceae bacterium]
MEHVLQNKSNAVTSKSQKTFFGHQMVQPKLVVGPVDDPFEREADEVADRVMRMPLQNSTSQFFGPAPVRLSAVQRRCETCASADKQDEENGSVQLKPITVQRKCDSCDEEERHEHVQSKPISVQRQCAACTHEDRLQPKHDSGASSGMPAPESVGKTISNPGQQLDKGTRSFMESRFNYDFSNVRIHNDSSAHQSSSDIHARAYTQGNHIVFGNGHYQPNSSDGRRLLAHELSHTIQQGAVNRSVVQREVEPGSPDSEGGIKTASTILSKIRGVEGEYKDKSPKIANLMRLIKLGFSVFNPGAPGAAGPTNAFVYTCRCGWIDMGHFFVSAAVAYKLAILQQMDFKIDGKSFSIEDLLLKGFDKAEPGIGMVVDTVPGQQSKEILARVRELIKSGNPAALALAFGYGTEFYQQTAKLFADEMKEVPKKLEGEQRSAFTIEDLSSDCYGSDIGYQIWKELSAKSYVDGSSVIHDSVERLLKDCKAVSLTKSEQDALMEETSPGSVKHVEGVDKRGVPIQDENMDSPNLLKSAPAECKDAKPLLCNIGKDSPAPGKPLPEVTLNISTGDKTMTVSLPPGSAWSGGKRTPGTAVIKIEADGKLTGAGKVDVPGLGVLDVSAFTDLDFGEFIRGEIPQVSFGGRSGELAIDGRLSLSYDGLERFKKGPIAAEIKKFEEILKSGKVTPLLKEYFDDKITFKELKDQLVAMLKEQLPGGVKAELRVLVEAAVMDFIINCRVNAS